MKQNLPCSIVQDLIPNYIEKLASEETNHFLEEHMNSCEQCHDVWKVMTAEIGKEKTFPKVELKFLKKIKKTRIIAGVFCLFFALLCSFWLYSKEYTFTSDKGVLSTAITEYTSAGDHSTDAYVLETKEIDGVLIAFFKDNANPNVYGFARLLKGVNQKYRLVNVKYSPSNYSAVLKSYRFDTKKGTCYAVGGYHCENIAAYGLRFLEDGYRDTRRLLTFDIRNNQFLDLYSESDLQNTLREQMGEAGQLSLNHSGLVLLDSKGTDITESYRMPESGDKGWSASVATMEQFMLYVLIAIVLILGVVFARYFLSAK
ncbi:zf-HC2 domain-containing protein [Brevibacillus sp. B_LB10_24]|uniref:zf-HC2 domain-containing protein n=1 Tax=Brevibacillus sp. B_LB10_24 TaxID=3380645 RepID=UPI0038BD62DD